MKRITILGNNSGRNEGDIAILGNMLRDITERRDDLEFYVTTTNPKYIAEKFGHFNVKPISMKPWKFAIKNLGWPLYRAMTQTDLILICDNILFDKKFFNPLFNNLASISLFAPAAMRRGIPIMLYNVSVGPVDHPYGAKALQRVLDATELVVTRDEATPELFDSLNLRYPELFVHADCALNTVPPSEEELDQICAREGFFTNPNGTVGFNVNAYIDSWHLDANYGTDRFLSDIASAADTLIEDLDVDILFIITQFADIKHSLSAISKMNHQDRVKWVSNKDYGYEVITGIISRLEMHNGLRTHPLIFGASVATPILSISAYAKTTGFLRTINQEQWEILFSEMSAESLVTMLKKLWAVRAEVKQEIAERIPDEKEKARATAAMIDRFV